MDATELRIGNYLERYGKIVKIVEIGIKHKNDTNYYLRCEGDNSGYWIDQFKPIPLTEEILLKCGFKYLGNGFYESSFSNISIFSLSGIKINIGFKGVIIGEIKHLHQLQNLYFALTNQELDINI